MSKFIDEYVVTDASVHDSKPPEELLSDSDKSKELYAYSAYTGEIQEQDIAKKGR